MNEKQPDLNQPLVPENIETPKSLESEISPEIMEKVMAKVQDINAPDIAYTVISSGRLESILKNGLLGVDISKWRDKDSEDNNTLNSSERWKSTVRDNVPASVYFNITDRSAPHDHRIQYFPKSIIDDSYFFRYSGGVVVLFALDGYKEIPKREAMGKSANERRMKYFIDDAFATYKDDGSYNKSYTVKDKVNSKGQPLVDTEHGFRLANRVAPRRFTGIVLKVMKEIRSDRGEKRVVESSHQKWLDEAERIEKLIVKNHPDTDENILLPIYDNSGNLLWPKQMSYEEVKKFVAERDKDKKEEKND